MKRILISACLLGMRVRYNGESVPLNDPNLMQWLAQGRLIPFCPEVAGGLPIPRPPAEIAHPGGGTAVHEGKAQVHNAKGMDVTALFVKGAALAMRTVRELNITTAVLKEGSPSCGVHQIYNGRFNGVKIKGMGVTAAIMHRNNVHLLNDEEFQTTCRQLMSE